ncbi:MAG TPA: translation initiation factor [Ghiorsea sp.]|nr:translation initiation factor [Ghiorsea sp.]HIP07651.1 translation initiation factor [Mariprofundaceae bacterium]
MSSDRVLVYSSEDGMINKSSQPSAKASKRKKKRKIATPSPIKNPNKQGVRIMRESKGRGGKSVSVIAGLNLDKGELKTLSKTLKAQLGTGGAIKESNIEIQGDHREKLLKLLEKQGIKAKIAGG